MAKKISFILKPVFLLTLGLGTYFFSTHRELLPFNTIFLQSKKTPSMQKNTLIQEVNPTFYQEKIAGSSLVVALFYRPTCPYCAAFFPTFQHLAEKYKNKISFIQINSNNYPELKEELGVKTHPCLMIYKQGVLKEQIQGDEKAREEKKLIKKFNHYLD